MSRYETSGTPQGGVISPLLSGIYLTPFDRELQAAGYAHVRYADDVLIRMGLARMELRIPRYQQLKLFESLGSRDSIGVAGCGQTARPVTTGAGIP